MEQPRHGRAPVLDIADPAVLDRSSADLAQRGDVARYHRRSASHRFDQGKTEAFALGGLQHDGGAAIQRRERPLVDAAERHDAIGNTELAGQALLTRRERPADANETNAGNHPVKGGADAQQHVNPFARRSAADVQELDGSRRRRGQPLRFSIGHRVGRRRKRVAGAKRHDHQPILAHEPPPDKLVAHRGSIAGDACRALQAGQDPARGGLERRRPWLLRRRDNRPERIEVVTGHDRPIGRQRVDEMCVAVVDDVEHIERGGASETARIVPEPVQEAVGADCLAQPAGQRHAGQPARKLDRPSSREG